MKLRHLFNPRLTAKEACDAFDGLPEIVRLPRAVHSAVFAPTGVGKGVSLVVPFLRGSDESAVVVDFKGENARLSADARRRMGHRVVLLDPCHVVTRTPGTFNPLDFIEPDGPAALDECNDLAHALVARSGREHDPHWNDSAEAYIAANIAVTVAYGNREKGNRCLPAVREILSHPSQLDLATRLMGESDRWNGLLAQMGGQLMHFADREKSSVLSTALRHLRFLGTVAASLSTRRSSFDPAGLRNGRMTIYLILPPQHMKAQAGLLRMWVGSFLRACVRGGLQ